MLQTLFPMATRTHRLNNGFLVEEQEESGHSERHGDFQQGRTLHQNVCECVFVCFKTQTLMQKISSTHAAYTLIYRYTNRCKFVAILCLLSSTMVIVFGCLHTSIIDFQIKQRQKQGRKCYVMICVCIHVNTWLITIIMYSLRDK